jgi:L-histidine N-alpha-methyltransferase
VQVHLTDADIDAALVADVRTGLTASPKHLPPKWFYDARGSELFEQITALPEYYPTRTERAVLAAAADSIAEITRMQTLVELGSGSSEKTRLLLDAGVRAATLERYVPQDVSSSALQGAVDELTVAYPALAVEGIVSDFSDLSVSIPDRPGRTVAFLGGTLGNLTPVERAGFLTGIAAALRAGEHLLIGVGLVVDESIVVPAYDDAQGVTAAFNKNVLSVIDGRLHADFDPDAFDHVAVWDAENEWIEMRLRALRPMTVHVADLDLDVAFAEGEEMRTEISAKFRIDGITEELVAAGFDVTRVFTDTDDRFAVVLATRA